MCENRYLHLPVVVEDTGEVLGVVDVMEIIQATVGQEGSSGWVILDRKLKLGPCVGPKAGGTVTECGFGRHGQLAGIFAFLETEPSHCRE